MKIQQRPTTNSEKIGILLVDAHSQNLDELQSLLQDSNLQLARASSGASALREVLANDYALVLLSVHLSDMDGVAAAQLIKQNENSAQLPIIFVASDFDPEHRKKCYEAGAVDYMVRPLEPIGLQAKLQILLELYRFKKLSSEKIQELQQLESVSDEFQRKETQREQNVLERFSNSQRGMAATARLHGEQPVHESAPEMFGALVSQYQQILEQSLDALVHETGFSAIEPINDLATKLVFLSAGPRDVLQIHKHALAVLCEDRPRPKVRATTEEGRFLLVQLLGSSMSLYRSMYKRHAGLFRSVNALGP